MRKVMTDAELKLWNELRAHRLMGLGFVGNSRSPATSSILPVLRKSSSWNSMGRSMLMQILQPPTHQGQSAWSRMAGLFCGSGTTMSSVTLAMFASISS